MVRTAGPSRARSPISPPTATARTSSSSRVLRPGTDLLGSELAWDGRWEVEPGEPPYKTRIVVVRPEDPARFNGTVVVLWNNVSAGYENFGGGDSPDSTKAATPALRSRPSVVGVHGAPVDPQGLLAWDPERYGSLSIPSDDYSFDIFTQAASVVGPDRADHGVDPMGGLEVRRLIAEGSVTVRSPPRDVSQRDPARDRQLRRLPAHHVLRRRSTARGRRRRHDGPGRRRWRASHSGGSPPVPRRPGAYP